MADLEEIQLGPFADCDCDELVGGVVPEMPGGTQGLPGGPQPCPPGLIWDTYWRSCAPPLSEQRLPWPLEPHATGVYDAFAARANVSALPRPFATGIDIPSWAQEAQRSAEEWWKSVPSPSEAYRRAQEWGKSLPTPTISPTFAPQISPHVELAPNIKFPEVHFPEIHLPDVEAMAARAGEKLAETVKTIAIVGGIVVIGAVLISAIARSD
jgi:hypothetical protein